MRTALALALLLSASVLCAADTAARPALRVKREVVSKSAVVEKAAPVELRGGGAADALSKISLPKEVQLLIASAGIFLSFSFFAIKQEDVYKRAYGGEYFAYTFFALVIERGINALVALIGMMALGKSGLRIPHLDIFNSGVSQVVAMAASNEALRYVSYPTQVLGKSCKMVPVMAGGIVLGGRTYSTIEYLQVLMITMGVVVFNFGGKKKGGGSADSPYGLALIAFSLLMDAFTGGLQDKVKTSTKALNPTALGPRRPTMHESMFYTNVAGCLVALVLARPLTP
jgi:solute carrier family 35 (UDP-galactose transporter), member B1